MAMSDETQFCEARNVAKTELSWGILLVSFRPSKLSDCCGAAALGRIGNLTTKLAAEIRLVPRQAPWSARALDMLGEVNNAVEIRTAYHAIWRAFRGTQDPHREFLYWGVLRVWTDRLGRELKYSMSRRGKPGGPLVRFFTACVAPVLGVDETPQAGIADIIDRESESRRRTNLFNQGRH
jgi:hypothetical protein